ncbi:MAG: hypothetical protein CML61_12325 [Rhodobacteraceae bacterium]|nr:hypothetical protein [Paracoccaceae bacterium]|tara:strand:+ start:556 stop:780 length:225 start_codon:yes stop_codon:yes gene_type:complete
MSAPDIPRSSDERLLMMLDLREAEGLTAKEVGERFGVSKSAVLGAVSRVLKAEVPCACTKPENQDGAMGRRWWK